MSTEPTAQASDSKRWLPWAFALLVLYLIFVALGWNRTVIATEAWALLHASVPFNQQMAAIRADLVHPPAIYLIERAWLGLFGQTDNAAKALPLLFGIPAIFVFTALAVRVTQHWKVLSFLLIQPYIHVGSAVTQVRMYGLALLEVGIAILLWERWRESSSRAALAGWVAVMTLAVYTHLFSSLLLVGFVVVNWLFGPKKIGFTLAAVVPGLLFVPWVLYVLPVYFARGIEANVSWVPPSPFRILPIFFYGLLGEFYVDVDRVRKLITVVAALVQVLFLFFAWRARGSLLPARAKTDPRVRWFYVALLLAGVPIAILFAFSIAVRSAMAWRFVLGILPAYWIVLYLLCEMNERIGRIALYAILVPWGVLVSIHSAWYFNRPAWHHNVAVAIVNTVRPDDLVLCGPAGDGMIVDWELNHRLRRATGRLAVFKQRKPERLEVPIEDAVTLDKVDLGGATRVWLASRNAAARNDADGHLRATGYLPDPSPSPVAKDLSLYVKAPSGNN